MKRFITGSFLVLMSILSGFPVQAGKSLDEIDRESFAAKYTLSELPGISMIPVSSVDTVRNREYFSLDGIWLMAEGGDEKLRLKDVWTDAVEAVVPGSVHTALLMNRIIPDPYIGQNDSIAEQQSYKTWWFSKKFTLNEPLENPILSFGGVANRCTVWLNGKKLGSHEGMFGGPDFAVKKYLKKENTLVVKLDPIPQMFLGNWPPNANESWKYTVVFNCVYGWHYAQIPSLGIWRSVKLESQAPVEIEAPFVSTRSLQGDMRLAVTLKKINAPLKGKLQIRVVPKNFEGAPQFFEHEINSSKKTEQFSFDFKIDAPRLWWPNDMGEQSLYDMTVAFIPRNGARPDVEKTSFGIRTIDMAPFPGGEREDRYNWTFVINGKPMFVKGTGWCTMDALMDFSREKYDRLLSIAKSQHIQMMRAWGGGLPETDDFYELCDKYGIMVIQEWPTAWNSHNTQPFDMLQETVVRNMKRIRNHPSLVMWGAGNESDKPFGPAIDMMGRLSLELDGSRPFHRGEAWGGSDHNYNCWWDDAHLNHNLNMTSPFWGEFGIASLPHIESVRRYLAEEKDRWPSRPGDHFRHHTPIFGTMGEFGKLSQYSGYFMPDTTLAEFITGSQLAQVVGVRHTLERARTLWPETTGALYYKMNDNYPGVSWSSVDYYGAIKPVHYFVQKSFAPLTGVLLFDRTNLSSQEVSLPLYLLDDCSQLNGKDYTVLVTVYNDRLDTVVCREFDGHGELETVKKLGNLNLNRAQTKSTMLFFVVDVCSEGKRLSRNYYFTNYEVRRGVIMSMPRTEITMKRDGRQITVTNVGKLPAIGVYVESPGYAHEFIASKNYLWLDPGESQIIEVNVDYPVCVKGWNIN